MGSAREITQEVFDSEVASGAGVAVIDFGATWCGPCQALAPAIDAMAEEFEGKAIVGKVDVDQNPTLASQFGIMSVPTIVFFKDGQKVDQVSGNAPDKIRDKLKSLLG